MWELYIFLAANVIVISLCVYIYIIHANDCNKSACRPISQTKVVLIVLLAGTSHHLQAVCCGMNHQQYTDAVPWCRGKYLSIHSSKDCVHPYAKMMCEAPKIQLGWFQASVATFPLQVCGFNYHECSRSFPKLDQGKKNTAKKQGKSQGPWRQLAYQWPQGATKSHTQVTCLRRIIPISSGCI